jgi:shikimate kinase
MSGRTVTLVGFMGCGKTTVGRILALRLHWPLKDTDALVEEHEGIKVAEVFRVKGEPYFRDLENRIALSTPDEGNRVLALGGGGFNEATIPHLNRIGPTIHLDLTFQEVQRRVGKDPSRPLSSSPDLFGLFIRRRRFYSQAHHRVWVEGLTVDEAVDAILRVI